LFADTILPIEEMVTILDTKIQDILKTGDTIHMTMMNSSGQIEPLDIKQLGEWVVHI
jgi:chromatin remodeling complex protein RSC6